MVRFLVLPFSFTVVILLLSSNLGGGFQHACAFVTRTANSPRTLSFTESTTIGSLSPTITLHNNAINKCSRRRSFFHRNLGHVVTTSLRTKENEDDEVGGVFYDDFGGAVIGGPSSSTSSSSSSSSSPSSFVSSPTNSILQERIASLKQQDMKRDAQLAKNWRCGNWKVRGFSLDTQDPKTTSPGEDDEGTTAATSSSSNMEDEPPIHISQLAMMGGRGTSNEEEDDGHDEVMAVARTDGSVVLMQLGTEYLAKFTAKLTATSVTDEKEDDDTVLSKDTGDNDNDDSPSSTTIRVESKLEKQEITSLPTFSSEEDGDYDEMVEQSSASSSSSSSPPQDQTPFEILTQFTPHQSTITALLLEKEFLYTAGQDSTDIRIWQIPENLLQEEKSDDPKMMIPLKSLSNAHTGTITSLHPLSLDSSQDDPTLLLSTASDGSFAIWDLGTGGDLVFSCTLEDPETLEPVSITCADVDRDILYLGLSTGHVVGYRAKDIIEHASMGDSCPIPNCRFVAHDTSKERFSGGGVTAIRAAGDGTIGRNRSGMTSKLLLTGGSDGLVKQWEILGSESSSKLEHWPRMASQRMQRRAHLFKGHLEGPVSALACLKGVGEAAQKFLSAGADGTVRAWNPSTGTELFRMDGFEEVITSLCMKQDLLITNGMEEYVCIHDFDVTDSEIEDGYEIEEW